MAAAEPTALPINIPINVLAIDIEQLLFDKGKNDETLTPKQFATLAAEYLLQQYDLAKAETTLHFGSTFGLLFNNINHMSSKSLVTVGLLSAFAVDIAMFGGSASLLIAKNPFF